MSGLLKPDPDGCDFAHQEPPFLSLDDCERWVGLANRWGVSVVARGDDPRKEGFMEAYRAVRGDPDELSCFWRKKRQGFCARHFAQIERRGGVLWRDQGLYQGLPTRQAMALIMWAWHPDPRLLEGAYQAWVRLAQAQGWDV